MNKKKYLISFFCLALFFLGMAAFVNAQTCPTTGNWTPRAGVCFPAGTGLPETPIATIVSTFLRWILGIFGALALVAFVISGLQYIFSAGSDKMIETAKRNMTWSIVGVVVALSGFIIVNFISGMLGGSAGTGGNNPPAAGIGDNEDWGDLTPETPATPGTPATPEEAPF
jgi:hypothetical protein